LTTSYSASSDAILASLSSLTGAVICSVTSILWLNGAILPVPAFHLLKPVGELASKTALLSRKRWMMAAELGV